MSMHLERVCQRCRMVFAAMDIEGGDTAVNALFSGVTGLRDRLLCPKCGGWVVTVEKGKELPREFRLAGRPLLKAVVSSAVVWSVFLWGAGLTFLSISKTDLTTLDQAQKTAYQSALVDFPLSIALMGAIAGCLVLLLTAALAARRSDLDDAYPNGLMPFGQAALMFPTAVIGAAAGVLIALWLAPKVAPVLIPLRGPVMRGLVGAIQGTLAAALSHRLLFRFCRQETDWRRYR